MATKNGLCNKMWDTARTPDGHICFCTVPVSVKPIARAVYHTGNCVCQCGDEAKGT